MSKFKDVINEACELIKDKCCDNYIQFIVKIKFNKNNFADVRFIADQSIYEIFFEKKDINIISIWFPINEQKYNTEFSKEQICKIVLENFELDQ